MTEDNATNTPTNAAADTTEAMATNRPYTEAPPPQWRPTATGPPREAMNGAAALDALIWSQGKPAVAAERLGLPDADSLLAAIVTDESQQDRLRAVMRSFAMLRLLGTAEQLEDILMERMDQLDAPSIARLFGNILSLADQMTRGANSAGASGAAADPREALLKGLPANVRAALRVVNGSDPTIYNDDAEQAGA